MSDAPIIGRTILRCDRTASTNDAAREYAERGEPEGLVITAEEQTAGRGRMGRRWLAPYGTSLQLSALLRPPLAPQAAARLTQMAALAVAAALEQTLALHPALKWPNDVLLPIPAPDTAAGTGRVWRKVAGILTESALRDDALDYCVLGIGLNVNFSMSGYPELASSATTVQDVVGHPVDRAALERALLAQLNRYYARICRGASVLEEYCARLGMLGDRVRVSTPDGILEGIAARVAEDGALVVTQGKREFTLYGGEVTLLKPVPAPL